MKCGLLIPCHNAAGHLPRLLDSVAALHVPFAEIICYDDASTDDTARIAQERGARLVRGTKRRGPAHARNQLLHATSLPWVHFHDADDLILPDFTRAIDALVGDRVDAVICDVEWVDEQLRTPVRVWRYETAPLEADTLPYVIEHPIGGINGVYRRSMLDQIGAFDERYSCWEDADLHVRLAAAGARFTATETVLCRALRRAGSASENQHACSLSRLTLLAEYAVTFADRGEKVQASIAREAEKIARALLYYGDVDAAGAAIDLCRRLGFAPPTTESRTLGVLKHVLSPITAMRLQTHVHEWARLWVRTR
jgi:glycosyltransferase involved in cell wall biosynthesis